MKLFLLFLVLLGVTWSHKIVPRQVTQIPSFTKLTSDQIRHLQNRGFGPTVSSNYGVSFQPTSAYEEEDEEEEDLAEDTSVASTQVRRPTYAPDNYPNPNSITVIQQRPQQQLRPQPQPQPQIIRRPVQQQQQYRPQQLEPRPQQQFRPEPEPQFIRRTFPQQQYRPQQQLRPEQEEIREQGKLKEEEEEEKEEPDRLSILLPQSRFDCNGKNTGYYADEELGCEVFHYCQDNARHSWICPEGFTFHQVHLICMPPSNENICSKSSQFHFVNDFLYKPINLEEHQRKPNITLKYSDRYYPENYYNNQYDEEDHPQHHQRKPIRVGLQQEPAPQPQQVIVRRPQPAQFSPTLRPETTIGQVFRSPEEVNISLQQRRPNYLAQRYINHEDLY